MKQFNSMAAFVAHLVAVRASIPAAEHRGLDKAGALVAQAAKDMIGHERETWADLADSTIANKERLGQTGRFSATDPLFATGEMMASISHEVEGRTVVIGSPDQIAVYQEFGTAKIPARSFLGASLVQNQTAALNLAALEVALAVAGKTKI